MQNEKLAILFLRVGIATVFLYASVAAMLDPNSWIGFFPEFLRNIFPEKLLLYTHSIAELILALWIFSGWKMFYAGLLSAGALLTIIIANITLFDIVFRDIAIFFAALVLAVLSRK